MNPIYQQALNMLAKLQNRPTERLYRRAKSSLYKDVAPTQNEFGCAEAVNNIFKMEFGQEIGGQTSTALLYDTLRRRDDFSPTLSPARGDICISPTGYGNGKIKNGHTGIVSDWGFIMSNDSNSGLFLENYTIENWERRYGKIGGFPVLFYRKIK